LVKRQGVPRFQLIILNRSSTDNWILSVNDKLQIQNQQPYLILRYRNDKGDNIISGIWFHNNTERDSIAIILDKAVETLKQKEALPQPVDQAAAASALLSPLTLGGVTIPVSVAPATMGSASTTPAHTRTNVIDNTMPPTTPTTAAVAAASSSHPSPHIVLDKKSLQLSLLSLIQDDRFLDLIHAQYLKVAHARASRTKTNGSSE